jgi:hypothetical protein
MLIDPNHPIGQQVEYVLIEPDRIELPNGTHVDVTGLDDDKSQFHQFCRSLDPNRCFIQALIPDDTAKSVFFKARDCAAVLGIHMQALVDTPERHRQTWQNYRLACQAERAIAEEDQCVGTRVGQHGDDDS